MKNLNKLICALLAMCLLLGLAACGQEAPAEDTLAEYLESQGITQEELDKAIADSKAEPVEETPAPEATPEPTPEPTPEATPTPTATPEPVKYPTVTKDPTSETLTEGGNALFIAYADDYQYITWYLISPDGKTTFTMAQAPYSFKGLSVQGDGTSKLTLCNCPLDMNGWMVECVFSGNGKDVATKRAYTYVNEAPSVQLYASPSTAYTQFCDQTVYLFAGDGDTIVYSVWRQNSYNCVSEEYASGTVKSGEAVYFGCINGQCWTYDLYAYVEGDKNNAISCQYIVDGIDYYMDHEMWANTCDSYGYTWTQVDQAGTYYFTPVNSDNVEWEIYVLTEQFTDANRYIGQAYTPDLSNVGTIYLPANCYVYAYCSANEVSGTTAPDGCRMTFRLT